VLEQFAMTNDMGYLETSALPKTPKPRTTEKEIELNRFYDELF